MQRSPSSNSSIGADHGSRNSSTDSLKPTTVEEPSAAAGDGVIRISSKALRTRKIGIKVFNDFIVVTSPETGAALYRLAEAKGDQDAGKIGSGSSVSSAGSSSASTASGSDKSSALALKLIRQWPQLATATKVKFHRGFLFCLRNEILSAWPLWRDEGSETVICFNHAAGISDFCLSSSADGLIRVIGSALDKTIKVWEILEGLDVTKVISSFKGPAVMFKIKALNNRLIGLCRPDPSLPDVEKRIHVWDGRSFSCPIKHSEAILGIYSGPLRIKKSFFSYSKDGTVRRWNVETLKSKEVAAGISADSYTRLKVSAEHKAKYLYLQNRRKRTVTVISLQKKGTGAGPAVPSASKASASVESSGISPEPVISEVTAQCVFGGEYFYARSSPTPKLFRTSFLARKAEFVPVETGGLIEALCPVVREESKGRFLLCAFYGHKEIRAFAWPSVKKLSDDAKGFA